MKQAKPARLKIHGFGLSAHSFICLCIAYPMLHLLTVLLLIPLLHFFPQLKPYGDWLSLWIAVPIGLLLLLTLTEALSRAVITHNEITLYWLGIPLRRIPLSKLALLAAVSDDTDIALCFTSYSASEMASMQEAHMLKGFFTRHDVPFRKRRPDWQDSFCKDFLNRQKKSLLGLFRDRRIIMTDFSPALVHILRSMHPDLPYRNYTGVTPSYTMQTSFVMEDVVPCLQPELSMTKVSIQPDGLHLLRGKTEIHCLRAQDIRTVAVVDTFRPYSKTTPYRLRILLVTSLTEQELSERAPKRLFNADVSDFPCSSRLSAMVSAEREAALWSIRHTPFCPICATDKNLSALQTLYPHAQWIDLSKSWLENS